MVTVSNPSPLQAPTHTRQWLAQLNLRFAKRETKTALKSVAHVGPLRVQRPFYPEGPKTCHVILLHPPGGMVVGDELTINANLEPNCQALITTPSAGKVYAVPGGGEKQQQHVHLECASGSLLEWLPQETLVFDGANGLLNTKVQLQGDAQAFVWDIVCLGRPASSLPFVQGICAQKLTIWRNGAPILLENNIFEPGTPFMAAPWGMQNANTCGTLIATYKTPEACPPRDQVDTLLEALKNQWGGEHGWGLTQVNSVFVARYLGNSARICRKGFETIWQALRPGWAGVPACTPRIWNT